jgi:hypothetical protein
VSLINPDETVEERKKRINAILDRNSQPVICDFCGKPTMRSVTNVGDSIDVVLVCDLCVKIVYTQRI